MLNPRVVDEILDMMMEISGLVVLSLRLVRLIFALVVLNPVARGVLFFNSERFFKRAAV